MTGVLIFFVLHWYLSLAAQSIFHHRYAAHGMYTLTPRGVKSMYLFSFITMGSSYLSPHVYGILHRLHHKFADKDGDPHPADKFHGMWGLFKMMWDTKNAYVKISQARYPDVEKVSQENLPDWWGFEIVAHSWVARLSWVVVYFLIYIALDAPLYLYPLLLIQVNMGPVHGILINWYAHKIGERPHKTGDSSTNLPRFLANIVVPGEGWHNNHHADQKNPNFAQAKGEFDVYYWAMRLLGFKFKRKDIEPSPV